MLNQNHVREEELLNEIAELRTDLECLNRDVERVKYTTTITLIQEEIRKIECKVEDLEKELEALEV